MPTEGIFVKVIKDGHIKPEDDIKALYRPITALVLVASDKGYRAKEKMLPGRRSRMR